MINNTYKLIFVILFFIAVTFTIYNIKSQIQYQNFTYFIVRYNKNDLHKRPSEKYARDRKSPLTEKSVNHNYNLAIHKKNLKIDINNASLQKLIELPGIGPIIARRIIKYREDHGGFQSIEDLMKIRGIGSKKIKTLKKLIEIRKTE
ncbi:MAG: hypothetical protein DRP84_03065 [Spirochaetes bacterium]|nr:MAG: hypothetical protein DRP84_03065 [Spirochaetota bacterium]